MINNNVFMIRNVRPADDIKDAVYQIASKTSFLPALSPISRRAQCRNSAPCGCVLGIPCAPL